MIDRKLEVLETTAVPLKEASGLGIGTFAGGRPALMAVGDAKSALALADLAGSPEREWTTLDLDALGLPNGRSQFEAVAGDGAGHALILLEEPAQVVFGALEPPSFIARITLEVPDDHPLAGRWRDDPSSRGEGMVPLRDGHLLLIKEKEPSALMEFGPEGDAPMGVRADRYLGSGEAFSCSPDEREPRLTLLATWMLDEGFAARFEDVSDAAIGPDGRLYLLSDQSQAIARLPAELPPEGGPIDADMLWRIQGKQMKAEGLAVLPDGTAVVALDTKKAKDNLLWLTPAIVEGATPAGAQVSTS